MIHERDERHTTDEEDQKAAKKEDMEDVCLFFSSHLQPSILHPLRLVSSLSKLTERQ